MRYILPNNISTIRYNQREITTKPETQNPKEQSLGLAPDWEGHYSAVIMSAVASQITSVAIVANNAMWKIVPVDDVIMYWVALLRWAELCRHKATQSLTHCGLVTPFGDIDLGKHFLR